MQCPLAVRRRYGPERQAFVRHTVWLGYNPIGKRDHAVATADLPNLESDGLHAYDGQIRDKDLAERIAAGMKAR